MPRKYHRRSYNRDKYSIEQTNFLSPAINEWQQVAAEDTSQLASRQWFIDVVPPSDFQGMRKVKHITISLANAASSTEDVPILYNIIYIPQGYQPQTVKFPANGYAQNNYQANQFVMSSGIVDFSAGPTRIRSRLSRNLNSGDRIIVLLATPSNAASAIVGQISYAITLQ